MARTIIIKIQVDNQDAINNIKAQREQQKLLQDQTAFNNDEQRKAETHANNLAKAQQNLTRTNDSLIDSIAKGYIIGRGVSAVFQGLGQSFGYVIGETAKLEVSFAKIDAVTGTTGASLDKLQDIIFTLSRNTLSSTSEIAEAALELAKLGISGESLNKVLSGVVNLSNALGDSLESTGQLVGGIVNTFNLSSEEAAKVADKLFVATGKSASNIAGFKVSFSLAGNVAEEAGIKFEQLAAAFAALSNQGIRASTTGTGFRSFIVELSKEGSKAQQALGGSIQELGLLGAMDKLAKLKLDPGSAVEIFGKPAAPVVLGLAKAGDATRSFLSDINNSNDALKESGRIINDTLIGSIHQLGNALVELGKNLPLGAVKDFFAGLAHGIQAVVDDRALFNRFEEFIKRESGYGRDPYKELGITKNTNGDKQLEAFLTKEKRDKEDAEFALRDAKDLASQEGQHGDLHKFLASDAAPKKLEKIKDSVDKITEAFLKLEEQFDFDKEFGNPIDYDETQEKLAKLIDRYKALGEAKGAIQGAIRAERFHKEVSGSEKAEEKSDAKAQKDVLKAYHDFSIAFKFFDETNTWIEKFFFGVDKAALKLANYKQYLNQVSDEQDDFNQKIEISKLGLDTLGKSIDAFSVSLVDAFLGHKDAFSSFQDAFGNLAKSFISQLIAMEVKLLAFRAAAALGKFVLDGFGDNGTKTGATNVQYSSDDSGGGFDWGTFLKVLAAAGSAVTGALSAGSKDDKSNSNDKQVDTLSGSTALLNGSTGIGASALAKRSSGSAQIIIHVQGDVYNAEKFIDKVKQANQQSTARYV